MTPAELAALIRGLAVDVFTENDLDPSVLPDDVVVERPRNPEHGDYATNVAMQAAGRAGAKPRDVAGWLVDKLAATERWFEQQRALWSNRYDNLDDLLEQLQGDDNGS